jgi:hypothetical protein
MAKADLTGKLSEKESQLESLREAEAEQAAVVAGFVTQVGLGFRV